MKDLPIFLKTEFKVRAIYVGARLNLRAMEITESLALNPLTVKVKSGLVVLYRYGVVVFFGVEPADEAALRQRIEPLIGDAYAKQAEIEEIIVRVDKNGREGMTGDVVFIHEVSLDHLQLIADVLAKSVVLAEYEARISQEFDHIEPLAMNLERTGNINCSTKTLLKDIGAMLLSEHVMVGRVNMMEAPDVLWENAELHGLYNRLEDEFEIQDRHASLERKLQLISRTAETLLGLVDNRHSHRLEWCIIILIGVEIVLSLCDILFR